MSILEDYEIIKNKSNFPCSDYQLNVIKNNFRDVIDSHRRFDRITSLKGLIRILEKRDFLNEKNVEPLKFIVSVLQQNELHQVNKAKNAQIATTATGTQQSIQEFPIRVLPEISRDPVKRVDDMICRDIGQKWNDLARNLNIPEGFIDELEHRYRRTSDMVREILIYHRENHDEKFWRVNLCKALEEARRKDLSLRVQDVFALHGLM